MQTYQIDLNFSRDLKGKSQTKQHATSESRCAVSKTLQLKLTKIRSRGSLGGEEKWFAKEILKFQNKA